MEGGFLRFLRFLDGDVGFRDAGRVVRLQCGKGGPGGGCHVRLRSSCQGNHGLNELVLRIGESGGVLLHLVQEIPPSRIPKLGAQLRIQCDLGAFNIPHVEMEQQVALLVPEYLAGDGGSIDGRGDFLSGREDADEQVDIVAGFDELDKFDDVIAFHFREKLLGVNQAGGGTDVVRQEIFIDVRKVLRNGIHGGGVCIGGGFRHGVGGSRCRIHRGQQGRVGIPPRASHQGLLVVVGPFQGG